MKHREKINDAYNKKADALKRKVCAELRWTDEEYQNFWLDTGRDYLGEYLKDEHNVNLIAKSRIFWAWWRNHWIRRDETFLEFATNTAFGVTDKRNNYHEFHDAKVLALRIYPNGVILNESYVNMIDELINEEVESKK